MTDLAVVVAMAAITYGSRVVFLVVPGRVPPGRLAAFLERFPLALFTALAASTLLVPGGTAPAAPGYWALGGAVAGGIFGRRSLVWVLAGGVGAYWVARALLG
jgi:branched-subunit amino acid transport protein